MTTSSKQKVNLRVHMPGNPNADLDRYSDAELFGADLEIADTDLINARRFVRDHKGKVRWIRECGWLVLKSKEGTVEKVKAALERQLGFAVEVRTQS